MKELGTNVQLLPNYTTPQKSDTYFNRKMKTNRSVVKFLLTQVLSKHIASQIERFLFTSYWKCIVILQRNFCFSRHIVFVCMFQAAGVLLIGCFGRREKSLGVS